MLSFAFDAGQRYADSRQALETAVRLKPDYAEAQYALGLNLQRDGQFAAAEAAYRRAVQADVRMPQAHLALGVVLQKQSKWDEAIAEMKVAVQLTPGDPVPESYLRKALSQRETQRGHRALRHQRRRKSNAAISKIRRSFSLAPWRAESMNPQVPSIHA